MYNCSMQELILACSIRLPVQLTAEKLQDFRVATAMAITRYCAREECILIASDGEQWFEIIYSV